MSGSGSNESGSVTGDEDDVWLLPLDARAKRWKFKKTYDLIASISSLSVFALGVYLLICVKWETFDRHLQYFVATTIGAEIVWLCITLVVVLAIAATLGHTSLVHSLSVLSMLNDFFTSVIYLCLCLWGMTVIYTFFTPFGSEPIYPPQQEELNTVVTLLFIYTLLSTSTCLAYTLSKLPVFFGVIGFAMHQVKRKLNHTPIVSFYSQYHRADEFYVRVTPVQDYTEFISRMPDPTVKHPHAPDHHQDIIEV